ncbi:MAG: MBL fold metallo-hydrolase RNA specificity domain-containing protein [Dehalococcoidia bacterium]
MLRFLGAAGNVTGSRFLLESGGRRVLVECGLNQEREFAGRNWDPFPVDPRSIDAVILTHAHLDHSGYLPRLVRDGFSGPAWCTPATADLAAIVLADAARIAVEDADFKRRRHQREGRRGPHPEVPLYTPVDARRAVALLRTAGYHAPWEVVPGIRAEFRDAGHILGSAVLTLHVTTPAGERVITFSGDLGRGANPMLRDPEPPPRSDYLVVESTYGDREHPDEDVASQLADVINAAAEARGNVVIPAFAIGRTQDVLFHLRHLLRDRRIPRLLVFVDSPMATSVTQLHRRHLEALAPAFAQEFRGRSSPFEFPGLTYIRSVEASKAINRVAGTAVIIAGAGMCNGGRVKHHLAANITRPESTILFVGYQAHGTLGRRIVDGDDPVRILGQEWPVRARVASIEGFSAHAGRRELLRWVQSAPAPAPRVLVVHGEDAASAALAAALRRRRVKASVPAYGERVTLA